MEYFCKESETIEFPYLYNRASGDKIRQWRILIRVTTVDMIQVPIKDVYLNDLPNNLNVIYWTESGVYNGKQMKSKHTICKETNIGKKNFKNAFGQAISIANSKVEKKIKEGFVIDLELKSPHSLWFPMLAHNYKEYSTFIKYPCFIQPKLDGIRCISTIVDKKVVMYSRSRKEFSYTNDLIKNIQKELQVILPQFSSENEKIFVDGELYSERLTLQEINQYTRKNKYDKETELIDIQYHIFDIMFPSRLDTLNFGNRLKIMQTIKETELIKIVPTYLVSNEPEIDEKYNKFLDLKFEGAIIRSQEGLYQSSCDTKSQLRSKDLLKRKEVYRGEYPVVGFTCGSHGNEVNSVIWICEAENGLKFKVTPNESFEKRKLLYADCLQSFHKFKDRMICVEYRSMSKDKIPQHAKAIYFRDIE